MVHRPGSETIALNIDGCPPGAELRLIVTEEYYSKAR